MKLYEWKQDICLNPGWSYIEIIWGSPFNLLTHWSELSSHVQSPSHQLLTWPKVQSEHVGARWWPQLTLGPVSSWIWNYYFDCKTVWIFLYINHFGLHKIRLWRSTFVVFAFGIRASPVSLIFTRSAGGRYCISRSVCRIRTAIRSFAKCVRVCFGAWYGLIYKI